MDIQYAKELLTALADGVNPLTGELLPEDDSCNQVDIVRALHTVIAELDKTPKKRNLPQNAGKPWTHDEDVKLISAYQNGDTTAKIAKAHGRSKGGIAARLVKLGIVKERYEAR